MTVEGSGSSRPLDVVYVLGHDTEELRYSLRSLQNVEHGRVWIAGIFPKWVRNVTHIPVPQNRPKAENTYRNVLAAASHPEVSDDFVMLNDDFFAVEPTTWPQWNQGGLARPSGLNTITARSDRSHRGGRAATFDLCVKWGLPTVNYEGHCPFVFNKRRLLELAAKVDRDHKVAALHYRTLYGNYFDLGGEKVRDVKVGNMRDTWRPGQTWVSTSDKTFERGAVGKRIRSLFPDPSPYEEANMSDTPEEKPKASAPKPDKCGHCGKRSQVQATQIRRSGRIIEILECGHRRDRG